MTTSATRERRDVELATGATTDTGNEPLRPAPPVWRRPAVELHLITYLVGNLLFWTIWAAISISTDHWYWCPIVPLAGWTVVLALHLWIAHRRSRRRDDVPGLHSGHGGVP